MVSILTLIFNSSHLFSKLLETVPSSPIIRGITISYQYLIDPAHSVHNFDDIRSRENWARLVLDIMHYLGGYLLIVDFLWKELGAESVAVIAEELEKVILVEGLVGEVMMDNILIDGWLIIWKELGADRVALIVEELEKVILVQGLIEEVRMNNSILIRSSPNYVREVKH